MEPQHTPDISVPAMCDALGRRAIAARIGVGVTAVSNACVDGRFPAAWYVVVKDMCEQKGIGCPLQLFNWRPATSGFLPPSGQPEHRPDLAPVPAPVLIESDQGRA